MRLRVLLATLLFTKSVSAQNDSNSHLQFSGYIDCYYAYNFTNPVSKNIPNAYNHSRHNEFNVNNVFIGIKYSKNKVHGNVTLHTGTYVEANYAAEPKLLQFINEASVGVNLTKKISLDAGIMPSHIGLETAISKDNWTLTRSLCAENSPYYETGIKLNFIPNEKWSISALVLNGWQNIAENNSNKAVGTQIQFMPNKKFTLNYSTFFGEGRNLADSLKQLRLFQDVYFTYLLTNKIAIAAVCVIGHEQKTASEKEYINWFTPALFLKYKMSSKFITCLRAEYFNDYSEIIGIGKEIAGYSINLDYLAFERASIRLEAKTFPTRDSEGKFDDKSFVNSTITASIALSF